MKSYQTVLYWLCWAILAGLAVFILIRLSS